MIGNKVGPNVGRNVFIFLIGPDEGPLVGEFVGPFVILESCIRRCSFVFACGLLLLLLFSVDDDLIVVVDISNKPKTQTTILRKCSIFIQLSQ
jgi:hypothetical protein